jgi:hypothetical protein
VSGGSLSSFNWWCQTIVIDSIITIYLDCASMAQRGRPRLRDETESTARTHKDAARLDDEELVAAVCAYFCRGHRVAEIASLLETDHGIKMSREEPYRLIRHAAKLGWLRFVPPHSSPLATELTSKFRWPRDVEVVHGVHDDLAYRSALTLMRLIRQQSRPPLSKQEVHIGWSGGDSMARIAAALARILTEPVSGLPDRLILHALVSGFDVGRPMTDPNAFFTYFINPALQVKVDFVGLHAPAIIKSEDAEAFFTLPGIREARESVRDLDIVVTSAASLADDHGMLTRYCQQVDPSGKLVERLRKDGCIGDMLWLPLSMEGPMNVDRYPYRGLTVIELEMLPQFIRRGKKILLSLGVCGLCRTDKADILKAILEQREVMISHLVTDSRTARALLEGNPGSVDTPEHSEVAAVKTREHAPPRAHRRRS